MFHRARTRAALAAVLLLAAAAAAAASRSVGEDDDERAAWPGAAASAAATTAATAATAAGAAAAHPGAPGLRRVVAGTPAPDLALCVAVTAASNVTVDAAAWVASEAPANVSDALRQLAANVTALAQAQLVAAAGAAVAANLSGTIESSWSFQCRAIDVAGATLSLQAVAAALLVRGSPAESGVLGTLRAQASAALDVALPLLPSGGGLLAASVAPAAWTSFATPVPPPLTPPAGNDTERSQLTTKAAILALFAAAGMATAVLVRDRRCECLRRRFRRRSRLSRAPYEVHVEKPVTYSNGLAVAARAPTLSGPRFSNAFLTPAGTLPADAGPAVRM